MTDDEYYTSVFEEGDVDDLEQLMVVLIKKGDYAFACAAQGRIDEINRK